MTNMAGQMSVEQLNDAFNVFKEASGRLQRQYSILEAKIIDLNAELAEKNRAMERTRRLAAMGEMAAKIAHEIRNPLGSIAIFASILERDLSDDPERKKLATHITKGVKTLDNLLSNMLLFASSPAARLKAVDLKAVMDESLLLAKGHEKKGFTIKTDFKGSSMLMADQGLLKQLFLNLFLNAFDAMDEGGELFISAKASRGIMEISVKDTGCGIPAEYLDRVFDPFFSTKECGTGLGLAIVSAIAGAHNGTMDINTGKKGTEFVFRMPVGMEKKRSAGKRRKPGKAQELAEHGK